MNSNRLSSNSNHNPKANRLLITRTPTKATKVKQVTTTTQADKDPVLEEANKVPTATAAQDMQVEISITTSNSKISIREMTTTTMICGESKTGDLLDHGHLMRMKLQPESLLRRWFISLFACFSSIAFWGYELANFIWLRIWYRHLCGNRWRSSYNANFVRTEIETIVCWWEWCWKDVGRDRLLRKFLVAVLKAGFGLSFSVDIRTSW